MAGGTRPAPPPCPSVQPVPRARPALQIVYELAEMEGAPTLASLAAALEARAHASGPWLVSTPLTNVTLPQPIVVLSQHAVLQAAHSHLAPNAPGTPADATATEAHGDDELGDALGDRLPPLSRWLRDASPEGQTIDTRCTASLLSVEVDSGTAGLARARARSRALYVLAVWVALRPPGQSELLPGLGVWAPQPFLRCEQGFTELEPDQPNPRKRVREPLAHWDAEYTPPEGRLLSLPVRALALVRERRCPQALLSSCSSMFEAAHGDRFKLAERLRAILAAVEAVCEEEPGAPFNAARWRALSTRFGINQALDDLEHTTGSMIDVEKRLRQARNVATHGADAVLLDLGYPEGEERILKGEQRVSGEELSSAALDAGLGALIYVVQRVLAGALEHMDEHDWDDEEFERLFVAG